MQPAPARATPRHGQRPTCRSLGLFLGRAMKQACCVAVGPSAGPVLELPVPSADVLRRPAPGQPGQQPGPAVPCVPPTLQAQPVSRSKVRSTFLSPSLFARRLSLLLPPAHLGPPAREGRPTPLLRIKRTENSVAAPPIRNRSNARNVKTGSNRQGNDTRKFVVTETLS